MMMENQAHNRVAETLNWLPNPKNRRDVRIVFFALCSFLSVTFHINSVQTTGCIFCTSKIYPYSVD
jgi:hypothetical protein